LTQYNKKVLFEYYYRKYNKPELINPDPLQFLYKYPERMEITGFISSCFALGRVNSIISTLELIFKKLTVTADFIISHTFKDFYHIFKNFKYRFFTVKHISFLLAGLSLILKEYGSLENLFCSGRGNLIEMQKRFITELSKASNHKAGLLLADPEKGSACKRLNLFLRWMVRKDLVDPGVWSRLKQDKLLVPVDTHMLNISRILGFTERKTADLKTAFEITEQFKRINPEDPVKYDFSLTRMGIHPDKSIDELLKAVLSKKTA
jgi:uncharacterized protein (TIGR02757 family)